MEVELNGYMEILSLQVPEQVGFRQDFSTIDHIFAIRCLMDQMKARNKKVYCCFVDFCKAFDTIV